MKTLRSRLLLFTCAATASVLITAGLAIYFLSRAALYAEFDRALVAASRALLAASEQHARGVRLETDPNQFPEYARKNSPDFFEIWLEPGPGLARSTSLTSSNADLPRPINPATSPLISDVTLPDGRIGRQISLRYTPRSEEDDHHGKPKFIPLAATLVIARHTGPLAASLRDLRWLLFIVGLTATAVTALTLHWAVSRGLRPLSALATRIASTGQTNLLTPIELPDTPAELSIVVQRLNELLARLHDAITRERAFTADVSHELRTPLSGLEVTLEIASLKQRTAPDYESRIHKSLNIVREMRSMVDNLLTLARAEAGQLAVNQSALDLAAFIESCWANFQDAADDRCLTTGLDLQPLHVRTDPDKLRIVLHNLMDNAIAYCDPAGHIAITLRQSNNAALITITNPARSITPAQAQNVFDRFWRADSSRTETGVHCGLGLSLSQKIATLLAASLTVQVSDSHAFQVQLILPILVPPQSQSPHLATAALVPATHPR